MPEAHETQPADSAYHRRLPIGEVLEAAALTEGDRAAFDAVTMAPLAPMMVPEQPRAGVVDRAGCPHCRPSAHTIWRDDVWQVRAGWERMGLPFVGGVAPREHVLLDDAPLEVLASLGPLMQRLSVAVKQIPGVARCHFARWGDGSEHFHLWALARPAGMMQGRGAVLALWDEVLPAMPDDMVERHLRIVAEALAADGGEAFPSYAERDLPG
ncbi:hypothetical protein [Nocardioides euryhalodurans]|uniref:Diadenosine tetraphosphate hydrolase n=1 Tax=Nocardioides euryhalodurans TaxID=2518370 RepID=A0A4P7GH12_9ACTN|nr:hypothetical protein [Nocardioides euryhalodurans]QBR91116.1 hypothetical protein EXE57_01660 [Nocardioides euryhalodurans]